MMTLLPEPTPTGEHSTANDTLSPDIAQTE
jgi:hypothetical protein